VQDIVAYVESLSGHTLQPDEGVQYGPADRTAGRVTVCWMATADALEAAGRNGSDAMLTHESLFYPIGARLKKGTTQDWEAWDTNQQRRRLLDRYGLTLLRVHGSLDEICIFDEFARMLELGEPVEVEGLAKVYEIPPCPLRDLVERVKKCVGLPTLRVAAPKGLEQVVHRVGLPWGGLGLHVNVLYQHFLIRKQCDVMIAGEGDNYGARFAAELGIPTIETDHEVSENPGLMKFCDMLREQFPGLGVVFFECERVWQTV